MRIMGIDYGDSRIGISISDPFGWTAQGVETINWKGNLKKPVQRINDLIKEHKVKKIVVGFPRNMDGTVGPMAEKILEFIDVLANETKKEIVKWDERLTTAAAKRIMHETGVKTLKKKSVVDQIAAVYILQGYLDSIAKQK
jgi:putative Holliday junction resolvase